MTAKATVRKRAEVPVAAKRAPYVGLVFVLPAVWLVYANSFGNSFHFDDFHTIRNNPAVRSLRNLPRIFTDATAFSVVPANQTYRPLVTGSLALDYAMAGGYDVFWFHLSTFVWFLVLIAVLYFFFESLFDAVRPSPGNRWLALGGCAWFGLHPAMAETVNYIIQRADLFCTLGCVAALVVYIRRPKLRRMGLYLIPFALAMLAKPTAAIFPVLLLLYLWFFESGDTRTKILACLAALAVTITLLALQAAMTPRSFAPSDFPAAAYRLTQPYVWLRYATSLFWPTHLNVDTDLDPFLQVNGRMLAGFAFALALLLAAGYIVRRRRREWYPVAFGLLWFVITQLPTSGYVLAEVENDHRMFFSFPGLILAVVWTLRLLYERLRGTTALLKPAAVGLSACALCAYAYGAHVRNEVWRTDESLWSDDVQKSPHNGRGLMIYGVTRMEEGDLGQALVLLEQAERYTPNYAALEGNLGVLNSMLALRVDPARGALAERYFRRAVKLAPNDDTTHAYYGRWLLGQGRLGEAAREIKTAVGMNGQSLLNRELLLEAYTLQGDAGAAKHVGAEILSVDPDNAIALRVMNAGGADRLTADQHIDNSSEAYHSGDFQGTIDEARKALQLDPRSAAAWNNIGAGYGALRQWDKAIEAEQHAVELDPGLRVAQINLRRYAAMRAQAQTGRK